MKKIYKRRLLILTFLLITILFFISKKLITKFEDRKNIKCVNDPLANVFTQTENYLKKNPKDTNYLLSVDSFFIDLTTFTFFYYFIINGQRTILISLTIFYLFRGICFLLTEFPLPKNYIFFFSYPSIFIPDKVTNDFFFSGHIGMLTVFILEAFHSNYLFFCIWIEFVWILTVICLFITQGHYTNDLIFGIFAGYISFRICHNIFRNICLIVLRLYIGCCRCVDSVFFENSEKNIIVNEENIELLN